MMDHSDHSGHEMLVSDVVGSWSALVNIDQRRISFRLTPTLTLINLYV